MGKIDNFFLYLFSLVLKLLSGNRLLILNYHRVLNSEELYFSSDIDSVAFSWQMQLVKNYLNPLSLNEGVKLLHEGKIPKGAVVVTFDDGYKDNVENVLPILVKESVHATFFISSAFLNGGIMWNDAIIESIKLTTKNKIDLTNVGLGKHKLGSKEEKLVAIEKIISAVKYKSLHERKKFIKEINLICDVQLPRNLMMNDEDVIQLYQSGMEIGGHTSNHPILACENDDIVKEELSDGKLYLEKLLNIKLNAFAYPNGKSGRDYELRHVELVKNSGFSYAVTTNWGINKKNTALFQLYRFTPWDKTPTLFLLRLLKLFIFNKI